eukprot:g26737.t1
MVGDWKVVLFVAYRAQTLYKMVPKSMLGLTDVEEATSGAADAIDHIDGCAHEPLSNVEGLFCAFNGGRWVRRGVAQVAVGVGGLEIDVSFEAVNRIGDGELQEGEGCMGDGPGEFEVGVKRFSKIDELFNLLIVARGSTDTVIDVMEEEM